MEETIVKNHSEGIRNYLRSIIEDEEIVEKKEFIKVYKSLSKGRKKGFNAQQTYKRLRNKKLVKFI